MTNAQTFGLILGAMILTATVFGWRMALLLLTENREARRYKALVDQDRAREIELASEVADLEIGLAMSGLDDELAKLLDGER